MSLRRVDIGAVLILVLGACCLIGCNRRTGPEVIVYVAVDRGQSEPILRDFEKESRIRVRAVYDVEASKTTGLVTRLVAEAAAPQCDVFWNNELVQTLMLADRGLLEPFRPSTAQGIPDDFRDPSGLWTAVACRARVIVYNAQHVAPEDVPQSIFDLTDPKWQGKVAIANPQFGTTRAHAAALFAVLGRERACQFFEDLLANDVRIVDGNAMVKNLVARADPAASPIYLGLTDTDDVLSGQADGEPVGMVYPDQDGFGTLVVPSAVGIIRGAPHPEAASQLAEYLVGAGVERRLTTGRAGFIPLRAETPGGKAIEQLGRPVAMKITRQELLEQLEPSSQWTRENFHH